MGLDAERLGISRINVGLLVLISASVLTSIIVGHRTSITPYSLFRSLILVNLLLIAYILLLRTMTVGILLYLYSLVFLNYYWRIVIPGTWPDLDIPRAMFVFIWLIFILEMLMGRKRLMPNGAIGVMMMLVMAAFILSMLLFAKQAIRAFLNGYVIPYAMFVVCKNLFRDRRTTEKFIFWLSVPLALYFPATAIFEHYRIKALVFPRYIGSAVVSSMTVTWGLRAVGAFIQPCATGMAMISIYVLAMYSLAKSKGAFAKVYAAIVTVLTPVGVFFTYTRSVYLGFVAALVILVLYSRRLRVTALIVFVAVVLGVLGNWSNIVTPNREIGGVTERGTAQARVVLFNASIRMFLDHPWFGVGVDNFIKEAGPYIGQIRTTILGYKEAMLAQATNQHNQLMSILTQIGLVGFIPFVILYILLLRMLAKARSVNADNYDSEFVIAVWGVMAAYIPQTLFIEPKYFEFMNTLPFMMMGIIAGGYERAKMQQVKGRRPGSRGHHESLQDGLPT